MRRGAITVALAILGLVVFPPGAQAVGELTNGGCVDDPAGSDVCAQTAPGLIAPRQVAVSPDGTSVYVASSGGALAVFSRAITGALTPAGCIEDNDIGTNGCAQSVNGLEGAFGVAVSPDGRSVYVASQLDSAVVRFNRSTTGALTSAGCIDDNDFGPDACTQSVNGLDGATGVAVSSDGSSFYVAARNDSALVRFNRSTTGALTSAGCIDDNDDGPDACTQSVNGMRSAFSVALSPDDSSVYVSAQSDNAVVRFNRSTTGALTSAGCIDDNDNGPDACAQSVNGLSSTRALTVSPDGGSVYVAGLDDGAVVRLNRSTTGALTPGGCVDDNDTGSDTCAQSVNGLGGVFSVAVSPDGRSVYAASVLDDAVVRFNRSTTGALTPGGCIDDNDEEDDVCAQSVNGLTGATWVTADAERSVYVTGFLDDSVVRFNRVT